MIPALRFVDDLFGPERPELAKHTLECACAGPAREASSLLLRRCVARLCRCVLGADSMSAKKMEVGHPLVILGLEVQAARCDFSCYPVPSFVRGRPQ